MKKGKVLLVGLYIPGDLTNHLLKDSWEVKCVRSPDPKQIQKAIAEFSPGAIVLLVPANEAEERAHQRITEMIKVAKIPTFIAGPLTWEKCSKQKDGHIDFASKFTHQDILCWVHSVCR